MKKITASVLKEWLEYEPLTGIFRWKQKPNRRIPVGSVAGSITTTGRHKGRIYIHICKASYAAHRLAWLYATGDEPTQHIDHINGNCSDNRIANLRDVPPIENSQNLRKAGRQSTTGLLGAQKDNRRGGYTSSIKVDKKARYLGSFETPEAAHAAYISAKRLLHKGCTI